MASSILIKRSTGTTAPGTIQYGELAVTVGTGTQANNGDRLFIGDNNSAAQVVGGKYFTDMLDHVHGTLTASSAVVVDSNSKVNQFKVDDLVFDANVLTTGTVDTDLIFRANGTGKLVIEDGQELEFGTSGDIELVWNDTDSDLQIRRVAGGSATGSLLIQDDIPLKFGTNNDARVYYDEATTDKLRWAGADQQFDNGVAVTFADTTDATSRTAAAVMVTGGLAVDKITWMKELKVDDDATIGTASTDTLTVNSTTTFNNAVTFNGTQTVSGTINQTGQFNLDAIRLDGNVISTTSGTELIIDPFPAGGDSEGLVIIKGDLQIDGTTTTVNSATMSVNDPVLNLADPTTKITVTTTASNGATVLVVDKTSGLNVGDSVTGTGIAANTTITVKTPGVGGANDSITLNNAITAQIDAGSELTVTTAANDSLDRGIKFFYHNGTVQKFGFFGYDRTGGADGNGAWTFFEDATDTNSVFGGTKGTVVIGDLELDTDLEVQYGGTGRSTFTTNGIIYGNSASGMLVTAAANMASPGTGTDATTSYQVLTVTASGVPVWTNTIDGGVF